MPRVTLVLAAVVLLRLCHSASAQPPSMDLTTVDSQPLIDGDLSEDLWQRPPDCRDFSILGSGKPAANPTEAWLARDDTFLFVAFRCHVRDAEHITCSITDRGGSVPSDESVEIFISPGTDGDTYLHFMVNADGVQRDNRAEGLSRNIDWDAHWRTATKVDKANNEWTLEVAIPLFYLQQHRKAGPWRINLARTSTQGGREHSAWAPVEHGFHEPEHFGTLTGVEDIDVRRDVFAPVLVSSDVGEFLDLPTRCYKVTIRARNHGGKPGRLALTVADRTKGGERVIGPKDVDLAPGHSREVTLTVPIEEFRERTTRVTGTCSDDMGTWVWANDVTPKHDTRPFVCCMDRSYYTTESNAHLVYDVNLPPQARSGLVVTVTAPFLAQPVSSPVVGASGRVGLPLATATTGTVAVTAELVMDDGERVAQARCDLIRRAPAPAGNEVKADRWNRCVLLNGKPYFPLGFISVPPKAYPLLAATGMDAVIHWGRVDMETLNHELNQAEGHGIFIVPHPVYSFKGLTYNIYAPEAEAQILKGIEADLPAFIDHVATHPATLAWFGFDEPGGDALRRVGTEFYQAVHRLDGHHPFFHNYCGLIPKEEEWHRQADVAMVDIYWLPSLPLVATARGVSEGAVEMWEHNDRMSRLMNKPLWTVTLNEQAYPSRLLLLPQEQRIHTYLDLIHGASGLFYFAWPVHHKAMHDALKTLAAEIRALSPALMRRTPPQKVTVVGGDKDMVHVLLKKRPEGGYILLAGNLLKTPVTVRFSVSGMHENTRVRRLFGDRRAFDVDNDGFMDALEGYGTRAYHINDLSALAQKEIVIALGLPPTPAAKPDAGEPEKNLVPNGGFETDGGWTGPKPEGNVRFDEQEAFSGKRSLRLLRRKGEPTITVASEKIVLKPHTRYQLSARMRGEFESGPAGFGGPTLSLYGLDRQAGMLYQQTTMQRLADWHLCSGVVETDADPETVQVYLYAEKTKYIGTAWIDEVALRELPRRETRNLLRNSSFEYATLPNWPDRWGSLFAPSSPDEMCGGTNAMFSLDDTTAVDGTYSLRLRGFHQGPNVMPGRPDRGVVLDQDKDYVFSIYMKTDTEGKKVWVGGYDMGFTEFTLTGDWKRYHIPARPAVVNGLKCLHMSIRTIYAGKREEKPEATVWLDAGQFEEGTEPTEYARDIYHPDRTDWMQGETPN